MGTRLCCGLLLATVAFAPGASAAEGTLPPSKSTRSPRDVFYSPSPGEQGMKVSVKLNRGGMVTFVPPSHPFRSGDQIRLVFATNFTGHIAVTNRGTSGKLALVYPAAGAPAKVTPSSNFEVPASGWLRFDNQPGQEKLFVVLSPKPLPEVSQPVGGQTTPQQQQEILDQLNGRALANSRKMGGRDLNYVAADGAGYVSSVGTVEQPWGFELTLSHQ